MKRRLGFTLIELIIVLAIASLIVATVILAAGGAQRNGRDTKRRADANKLSTAVESFAANHNGVLPANQAELNSLKTDYLDPNFKDPTTNNLYTIGITQTVAQAESSPYWSFLGGMWYIYEPANPDNYKIVVRLEGGRYILTP